MRKGKRAALLAAGLIVLATIIAGSARAAGKSRFTTQFNIQNCTFSTTGRNPYFVLEPGYELILKGFENKRPVELHMTVLPDTQDVTLLGGRQIQTRVLEEREWMDNALIEVSRNLYAICNETNSVFYFGEDVDIYENGQVVSHDGAWRAGLNGATPGIFMPGTFLLGSKYFQEIAPRVALDRAENVGMGLTVDVPAGHFTEVVRTFETSALESGGEFKLYAPGVGVIVDDTLKLEEIIDPNN